MLEGGESFGRVVEAGNGRMQWRRRQVGELLLKMSECTGRLKGLLRGFDCVVAVRPFDQSIGAPIAVFLIHVHGLAIARGDEREDATAAVRNRGRLCGEVRGDSLDVFHQRDGIAEDVCVNALQDEASGTAGLVEDGRVGVVDVAAAVGHDGGEVAVDLEIACDIRGLELVGHSDDLEG